MRRQPDVSDPGFVANGCGVSSSRQDFWVLAERLEHQPSRLLLRSTGNGPFSSSTTSSRWRSTSCDELTLQAPEDLLDLRGREPFLVLVEQRVVRLVDLREARDVLMLELQLPLEMRR